LKQDEAVIKEYCVAREEENHGLANRIWDANPDLQERMVCARLGVVQATCKEAILAISKEII